MIEDDEQKKTLTIETTVGICNFLGQFESRYGITAERMVEIILCNKLHEVLGDDKPGTPLQKLASILDVYYSVTKE